MKKAKNDKLVAVWACDFCGKEFETKKESDGHEKTCFKNPNRRMRIVLMFILGFLALVVFAIYPKTKSNTNLESTTKVKNIDEVFNVDNVFKLINEYRLSLDLPVLSKSDSLCELAQKRSSFLIANNMQAFNESEPGNSVGMPEQAKGYFFAGELIMAIDLSNFDYSVNLDQSAIENWKKSSSENKILTKKDISVSDDYSSKEYVVDQGCVAKTIDGENTLMVLIAGYKP